MKFADLKNDFVFRRIFATHPDILRGLLNDLLDRRGDAAIDSIEYLPSEQLPLVEGAKLSILDVRCKDRAGTTFVVEDRRRRAHLMPPNQGFGGSVTTRRPLRRGAQRKASSGARRRSRSRARAAG